MAMLEAFVYDPLISWRLLNRDDGASATTTNALASESRASNGDTTPLARSRSQDNRDSASKRELLVDSIEEGASSSALNEIMHNVISPMRTSAVPAMPAPLRRTNSNSIGAEEDEAPMQENLNAR